MECSCAEAISICFHVCKTYWEVTLLYKKISFFNESIFTRASCLANISRQMQILEKEILVSSVVVPIRRKLLAYILGTKQFCSNIILNGLTKHFDATLLIYD